MDSFHAEDMADFDERSGIVSCETKWGLWYQTLDEVSIEISVSLSTKSQDVFINSSSQALTVIVGGYVIISVSRMEQLNYISKPDVPITTVLSTS